MRRIAIIQARMGSTRLPGKVLMDIGGKTMLERVISRTQRAALVDKVVVATTTKKEDDRIVALCKRLHIDFCRGSENDVLDRYMSAASAYGADIIVRITSDCPFIADTVIDEVIAELIERKADYASNTLRRTFPKGLDVEAFTYNAFLTAWAYADTSYQHEHVTPYFYEHRESFELASVELPLGLGGYSHHRWTVDTKEDLEFVRKVYKEYGNHDIMHWIDILGSNTVKELHEG